MPTNPAILEFLDEVAAACSRSPGWLRSLVAAGVVTPKNAGAVHPVGATQYVLAAGDYTIWWADDAGITLDATSGMLYETDEPHAYLRLTATATLTVTNAEGSAVAGAIAASVDALTRTVTIEGSPGDVAAPRLILATPRNTSDLVSIDGMEHAAAMLVYLLGAGDPEAGSPTGVTQRRYEIQRAGWLLQDIAEQSALGITAWQVTGLVQSETVGIKSTTALAGKYLTELGISAEAHQ